MTAAIPFMGTEGKEDQGQIGEGTKITLRNVIGIVIAAVALVGFGIRIQSTQGELLRGQQTSLTAILNMDTKYSASIAAHEKELSELKAQLSEIQKYGTAETRAMQARLGELERMFKKP